MRVKSKDAMRTGRSQLKAMFQASCKICTGSVVFLLRTLEPEVLQDESKAGEATDVINEAHLVSWERVHEIIVKSRCSIRSF